MNADDIYLVLLVDSLFKEYSAVRFFQENGKGILSYFLVDQG